MPTAELLKPNRLNYLGRIWEKGVREPVDLDTARALEDNPRFKVRGFGESNARRSDDDGPRRPVDRGAFLSAIRGAVDSLDVDNEDAFTSSGKPHPLAVSDALGYRVTADDIDAALKQKLKPVETDGDLQPVKGSKAAADKPKSGVKITRVPRDKAEKAVAAAAKKDASSEKPKVETEDDDDDDNGSGSGGGSDPSTDGALEV